MPRIRTLKPQFWSSPDVAKAGPWARLLYMAMWNWADDYGIGTVIPKELEGFAFPHDDMAEILGEGQTFRDLLDEVGRCFGVIYYTVGGRPYYEIVTWDTHQKLSRSAHGLHPSSDHADDPDLRKQRAEQSATSSGTTDNVERCDLSLRKKEEGRGKKEEGRGKKEEGGDRSGDAEPPFGRPDVEQLCLRLQDWIHRNTGRKPTVTNAWRDPMRRMIDIDGVNVELAEYVIDWSQTDSFWRKNILSPAALRKQFSRLQLSADEQSASPRSQISRRAAGWATMDSGPATNPSPPGPPSPRAWDDLKELSA